MAPERRTMIILREPVGVAIAPKLTSIIKALYICTLYTVHFDPAIFIFFAVVKNRSLLQVIFIWGLSCQKYAELFS